MRFVLLLSLAGAAFGQGAADVRLVYALSGKPAAGVSVQVSHAGKIAKYTADARGRISAEIAPGRISVTDPRTGTLLLSSGYTTAPKEIEVGMPLRVSGEVAGFGSDPAHIEIDCGYGDRLTVSDYERQVQKLELNPRPDQDTVYGLALPPLPGKSLRMHPDASGRFTTEWFAAVEAPELLVFGSSDGRSAAKTLKLPRNVQPGATIAAGKIAPAFGATLEIKVAVPKTALPLGLLMGVESLVPAASAKTETAERLSTIHRQNPNLSQFLLQRRTIPLNFEGVTTVAGLPPIESLKLAFNGPHVGIKASRTVKVPARGVVRIELTAEELLGKEQPRVAYTGVVRFGGGGGPVAGATVVYSTYPDKYEATTDSEGRFQFAGVPGARRGILFIDAPNPGEQPPFDRLTISKSVDSPASTRNEAPVIEIPKPAAGVRRLDLPMAQAGSRTALTGLGTDFPYKFNGCPNFTQDDLQFAKGPILTIWETNGVDLEGPVYATFGQTKINEDGSAYAQILFPKTGSFMIDLNITPFVYTILTGNIQTQAQNVAFPPPTNLPGMIIQVFGQDGNAAPENVEVNFPFLPPDLDPFGMVTDANGQVILHCVSVQGGFIDVQVDDPVSGVFDGRLTLPKDPNTPVPLHLTAPSKVVALRKAKK